MGDENPYIIGRELKSWYRALGPESQPWRVWCESSDPEEVAAAGARAPADWQPIRLQKVTLYEVSTGWQDWDPNG